MQVIGGVMLVFDTFHIVVLLFFMLLSRYLLSVAIHISLLFKSRLSFLNVSIFQFLFVSLLKLSPMLHNLFLFDVHVKTIIRVIKHFIDISFPGFEVNVVEFDE